MRKSLLIYLITASLVSIKAVAQRDSVKVRVFNGSGNDVQTPTKVQRQYNDKNYVNFNPYLLARGAFVLGYERMLHNKHAFNIDAGLTYRDFIYEGIESDGAGDPKTGYYAGAAYKFYPKDYQDFDGGIYVSPGFITRYYNISQNVEYYTGTVNSTKNVDASYSMMDFSFKMGYMRESWLFDDVISDFYFGVGSRQITSHSYQLVDNTGGGQEVVPTSETKRVPALYLGIKIGFVF